MKKILIIGYGNPLRQDDGVGWYLAQDLLKICKAPSVEVVARIQLTPELAEPISRANIVLFIDASRECPAGEVREGRIFAKEAKAALNHHVSAEGLLQLADEVYFTRPEAYVFSIGVESLGYGTDLSPRLAEAYPSLMAKVQEFVRCRLKIPA